MHTPDSLTLAYAQGHPEDTARCLQTLPSHDAAELLRHLPVSTIASVLDEMPSEIGADILQALPQEVRLQGITQMSPPLAIRTFRCCDDETQHAILQGLEKPIRNRFHRALTLPMQTAGSLADQRILTLSPDLTVGEALGRIRHHPKHVEWYVYVVDSHHTLKGVVTMKALMSSDQNQRIEAIMTQHVRSILTDTPHEELLAHPHWRDFSILPIIDRMGTFVGALHHQTLRTIDEPQISHSSIETTFTHALLNLWELYAVVGTQFMTALPNAVAQPDSQVEHRAPGAQ